MLKPITLQNYYNQMLSLLGLLVALFSTSIGIGGGCIFVPSFMSIFKFDFKQAAGISLATIIPITFVGAASHLFMFSDPLQGRYFFAFIPMCIIGTIIGTRFSEKWNSQWLKWIFGVFLFIASLRTLKLMDFPFLMFSSLKILFLPALIGAAIGSLISGLVPDFILKQLFGIALMIIAFTYLLQPAYKAIKNYKGKQNTIYKEA